MFQKSIYQKYVCKDVLHDLLNKLVQSTGNGKVQFTKTSRMLVFCWYLVREKITTKNMSFKNRAILFSRTFSHSNSRGLYIRAGALRENKTHAKIS